MSEPRPVTVVLVDDHPLVRTGLRSLVESATDVVVVGEAADGDAAVTVVSDLDPPPDVVLMDLSMPGTDGVEATRRLVDGGYAGGIVVLTTFAEHDRVAAAVGAGAVGYLLKDTEPAGVLAGIRAAAQGHAPIDPRVARALLPTRRPEPGVGLSEREQQVLGLVAQGMANKQIARQLGISERTVKVHLGNVFRRIGVGDRTSAALWARENLPG
ncbi:MAG TPA: response regulator transcription factor [Nocardioides sp.]|nr:response regulator transcription factor [Nocardioides sp.]